jgi:probable addiction module antidote protein
MPRLATTKWDVADHLETEEHMALYLESALDVGDPVLISAAVNDIARARGMKDLAAADTDLANLLQVIRVAGLRLGVSVRH